jgi:hypothetical protein
MASKSPNTLETFAKFLRLQQALAKRRLHCHLKCVRVIRVVLTHSNHQFYADTAEYVRPNTQNIDGVRITHAGVQKDSQLNRRLTLPTSAVAAHPGERQILIPTLSRHDGGRLRIPTLCVQKSFSKHESTCYFFIDPRRQREIFLCGSRFG